MFDLLNKFKRDDGGIAVTELALVTPVFLLMFLSTIELGHMIYYSITVEKGLRSAVTYAGRVEEHNTDTIQNTKNIVMTGSPEGTGDFLVPGWADPGADVIFEQFTFTVDYNGSTEDLSANVVRVTADVPYVPVIGVLVPALEYLLKSQFRDDQLYITLTHEQSIIGN